VNRCKKYTLFKVLTREKEEAIKDRRKGRKNLLKESLILILIIHK